MLDGADVGVPVVARLLDQPADESERVLERLVDTQLLQTPSPGRYRLHDLLRLYAREQAVQRHPEPDRAAALTRALGLYAATTWNTLELLRPGDYRLDHADDRWRKRGLGFADATAALEWLEAERANLLAAVQQATAPGVPGELAVQLAQGLFGYLSVRSDRGDLVRVSQIALGAARRAGDRAGQATGPQRPRPRLTGGAEEHALALACCARAWTSSGSWATPRPGRQPAQPRLRPDRRGRGDSGDVQPYAPAREVEDLAALLGAVGRPASLVSGSAGCVLALDAASALGERVAALYLYEPPFIVGPGRPPVQADYVQRVTRLVADGNRDEAVEVFLVEAIGMPAEYLEPMKADATWETMVKYAHTLAYDGRIVQGTQDGVPLPAGRWLVDQPTQVVVGEGSEP